MFGLLDWFRRSRASKVPFPEAWRAHLRADVPFYESLDADARARFEDKLKIFVLTKHFEGANGFQVDDRVKVVIAAAAARLIMNMPRQHYQRLGDVVVYPSHYRHPDSDDTDIILGEAHHHGTVVLSWDAVTGGLANFEDGHDTATHEFAHVLDVADGQFDGTPVLRRFGAYAPWAKVMSAEFLRMRGQGEKTGKGGRAGRAGRKHHGRHVLRQYAATNEAEFFAVATEAFFEKPRQMQAKHPALFQALADYYRVPIEAGAQS